MSLSRAYGTNYIEPASNCVLRPRPVCGATFCSVKPYSVAGSPIKHERNRIVRESILLALQKDGQTPEEALRPIAEKIIEQARGGDTMSFREIADRLDGKPAQQVQIQGDAEQPLVARIEQVIVDPAQAKE